MSAVSKKARNNQIRIIAGRWRGRRLTFPSVAGLRPTPDRVRETLFNWLNPVLAGARCLDLFAGSGALGIEALSRGAKEVVFVEQQLPVFKQLRDNLQLLGQDQPQIIQADALSWLSRPAQAFDIVWLDPPFGENLLEPTCQMLEQRGWLSAKAYIYLEMEPKLNLQLPQLWRIEKQKTAGQVNYCLLIREN